MTVSYDNLTTMNNNSATTASTLYIRWQHWNRIVPVTVNTICILKTLWILFSLIYYGNKSKMWKTRRVKSFEKLNAGYLLMAAVLCAETALLRFIASQFIFNIVFFMEKTINVKWPKSL